LNALSKTLHGFLCALAKVPDGAVIPRAYALKLKTCSVLHHGEYQLREEKTLAHLNPLLTRRAGMERAPPAWVADGRGRGESHLVTSRDTRMALSHYRRLGWVLHMRHYML